jgi:hypothetical protein
VVCALDAMVGSPMTNLASDPPSQEARPPFSIGSERMTNERENVPNSRLRARCWPVFV